MCECARVVSDSFEISAEYVVKQMLESPKAESYRAGVAFDER